MKKTTKRSASCSDVQQLAEQLMIREFSRQLGRELGRATIPIGKNKVTVDGLHRDDNRVTLVEAWAHVGKAKSAQRNNVLSDMLKLAFVSSVLRRSYPILNVESHLIFADISAANVVTGNGWAAPAAKEFTMLDGLRCDSSLVGLRRELCCEANNPKATVEKWLNRSTFLTT
jgi:hypothetical protein